MIPAPTPNCTTDINKGGKDADDSESNPPANKPASHKYQGSQVPR